MSANPPSLFARYVAALNPFRTERSQERRRATRVSGNAISCSLGEVLDISATGIRVRCRRFYRPYEGSRVTLQFDPSPGRDRVTLRGTVCWTTNENGHWYAGVAFGAMSAADADTLGVLLRERGLMPSVSSNAA